MELSKLKIAKLLPLPILILSIFLAYALNNYFKTGEIFIKDIDLKGGTIINLLFQKEVNSKQIEEALGELSNKVLISISETQEKNSIVSIKFSENLNQTEILDSLKSHGLEAKEISLQYVGPELGKSFFQQVSFLLTIAYILIFLGTLIIYKKLSISFSIIIASLSNLLWVFSITSIFKIPISFAAFSSLLLLIGYAIDANVLLATRILKGSLEEFYEKYRNSLITGLTIYTGLIISMLIVILFSTSRLLNNIAEVLIIGFVADIFNTYLLNAGIIEVILIGKRR